MNSSYRNSLGIICLLYLVAPVSASADPAIWPQWRGPSRDGRASGREWPASFENVERLWRIELGPGYSGPIVSREKVFVVETRNRETEVVRALARRDGREVWKTEWKGAIDVPFFARANGSWVRSTPALDDGRLYVCGMRDVLKCLDAASGEILWSTDFVDQFGTPLPAFGFVSSPLVVGDHVFVQAAAAFVKLNKRTGDVAWRALVDEGGMHGGAFSSPVLTTLRGRQQLVVQMRRALSGVDPASGDVLWTQPVEAFRGMNILTPTVHENGVLTSAYGGGTALYRVEKKDLSFALERSWKDGAQGYMSTPVVIGGHAYLHLRNRRLTCIDLESGRRAWTTSDRFGKYMSLVHQGNRILALDERGILLLIRAVPDRFELIDRHQVCDSPTWGHIAVCGGDIFIRELHSITALRWQAGSSERETASF